MQNKGVARARLPSHLPRGRTLLAAGQTAGPATLAPSQFCPQPPAPRAGQLRSPRPRLVPADCGHVTARANREGPGRGTAEPPSAQQTWAETAERVAARGPGPARLLRPEGRDDPRPSNSCTMPSARPAGVPSLGSGVSWGGGRRGGRSTRWAENKSQGSSPPEASASQLGMWPFLRTGHARA